MASLLVAIFLPGLPFGQYHPDFQGKYLVNISHAVVWLLVSEVEGGEGREKKRESERALLSQTMSLGVLISTPEFRDEKFNGGKPVTTD